MIQFHSESTFALRSLLDRQRICPLVISLQGDNAKVHFLEGYHSGKSGFVIREWLKFTP